MRIMAAQTPQASFAASLPRNLLTTRLYLETLVDGPDIRGGRKSFLLTLLDLIGYVLGISVSVSGNGIFGQRRAIISIPQVIEPCIHGRGIPAAGRALFGRIVRKEKAG
jgi:hypothetical protein